MNFVSNEFLDFGITYVELIKFFTEKITGRI